MSTQPEITHIVAVQRWTFALGALLVGAGLLFLPPRAQLGAGLGAGLMMLNIWIIRRLSGRLSRIWGQDGKQPSAGLLLFLFNFKLLLLAALLFLCIRHLPVDPLALIVGVSILPAAIVLRAVQHALNLPPETDTEHPPSDGESGAPHG